MVRIRFRRVGARNQPSFRIVAAEKESPRDGRFLEVLGTYNPRTNPSTVKVDEARLFHWMSNGAQPSDSVVQTLNMVGTWERWERFKGGESMEALTSEAQAAMPEVDPRTRRDDQIGQRSTKRRRHPDAEVEPDEPKAEAEARDTLEAEAVAEEAVEPEEAVVEKVEADAEGEAPEAEAEAPEADAKAPEAGAEAPEADAKALEAAESNAAEDDAVEDESEGDGETPEPEEAEAEDAKPEEADAGEADPEPDAEVEGEGE